MLKNALLLSATLLLFSGCAERGYKLTVNKATGTVTAVKGYRYGYCCKEH